MKNYHQLQAETNNGDFEIGFFNTLAKAKEAAESDKNCNSPIYCLSGEVVYVWNEEILTKTK